MAREGRRSVPEVEGSPQGDRRSRILAGSRAGQGLSGAAIAFGSTVLVGWAIWFALTRSPNWDQVKSQLFDWGRVQDALPAISDAFLVNVKMFLLAEVIVLFTALLLAVTRSMPGPFFFPFRMLAIAYADFFRGIPTILLVVWLGLGVPGLNIEGVPTSGFFWGVVALVLIYTAYVSEVYRAGIDSVHPSQDAAARSLGLSRLQSMRHVVLPQAIRRMMPPLLNDFIGMQKDTALIGVLGTVDVLRQAQIESSATFNFSYYMGAALMFLIITIPMTRFVDWLLARDRRRRLSGGIL